MTQPKNGDFASYLQEIDKKQQLPEASALATTLLDSSNSEEAVNYSIQNEVNALSIEAYVDEELLDPLAARLMQEAAELSQVPPLSDEEIERQALEAGGEDGDPRTPE